MTHPTESPSHPPTVAKHPPPTLRHLLIERVQAAREMAAEWVEELQEHDEDDLQSEDEDDDQDLIEEETESDDPKYDWYEPKEKPVAAPSLMPVRQKGPTKFISLNMGWKGGKGKGKGKGPRPTPQTQARMRAPVGHATPITHTQVLQNPYRPHNFGVPRTDVQLVNAGWIPPMPPMLPKAPQLPKDFYRPGTQFSVGPMHQNPPPVEMAPVHGYVHGYTPTNMEPQPPPLPYGQPAEMSHPMAQKPPTISEKTHRRRHREDKEQDQEETDSSSTSCSTRPQKKRKRAHTVWLRIKGKKIPAKYRA